MFQTPLYVCKKNDTYKTIEELYKHYHVLKDSKKPASQRRESEYMMLRQLQLVEFEYKDLYQMIENIKMILKQSKDKDVILDRVKNIVSYDYKRVFDKDEGCVFRISDEQFS